MKFNKEVETVVTEKTFLKDTDGNRFAYSTMIEVIETLQEYPSVIFTDDTTIEFAEYLYKNNIVGKTTLTGGGYSYYQLNDIKLSNLQREIIITAEDRLYDSTEILAQLVGAIKTIRSSLMKTPYDIKLVLEANENNPALDEAISILDALVKQNGNYLNAHLTDTVRDMINDISHTPGATYEKDDEIKNIGTTYLLDFLQEGFDESDLTACD